MPPKKNAKPKRRWILFKTLAGRMSFVIGMTAVFLCAAAVYGVSTFYLIYGSGITITSSMLRIAASTAFLAAAGVLTAKLLGEVLITRRVKKLALIAKQVIDGKAAADTLPYGLGELDHITAYFEKLATDLGIARDTLEKNVKLRTSVLELSKGISEIERARTTALLDSIGEGVIATDSDGKISFLNEVAKDALWWNPDAAMDVPIDSAFRLEDDKENVIDGKFWPIRKVLKDGKKITTAAPTKPYYLRCRDKSRFPVKMTISPLIVEKKVVGALATFNDITIEVEFDRKKSEFISIASHQLRSPATGIKMLTDMLRNGDLGAVTEKQKEWFDKLYAGSDRMLDLINELLNISRLEAGVETEREAQDIAESAKSAMKEMETLLLAKKQKFAFVQNGAAKPVFDRMMIGEVMKNFISNASKYSPENGTVTLTLDVTDSGVKFSVADQGIGIPKSDHNRMFGKFFRAENAVKSPISGTGLGLYYCKTVIEKHGGEIGFDSEVGRGSTFWFILPLTK